MAFRKRSEPAPASPGPDRSRDEADHPATTTTGTTTSTATATTGSPRDITTADPAEPDDVRRRLSLADVTPLTLLRAAHPAQAVVVAAAVALAAALSGRAPREVVVVLLSVALGQAILGWHNDLVDARRDAERDERAAGAADAAGSDEEPTPTTTFPRKPIASGDLAPGTVWYAWTVAVLVLIPLSLTVGVTAGLYLLASVGVGLLGNVALRRGRFSFLPWAASFGLLVPYLSYGGWGGDTTGAPPQTVIVICAALLGIGVHVVRAIWGLVDDDAEGWTYLPLVLGRRLGATRLLVISSLWCTAAVVGLAVAGATVGLRR